MCLILFVVVSVLVITCICRCFKSKNSSSKNYKNVTISHPHPYGGHRSSHLHLHHMSPIERKSIISSSAPTYSRNSSSSGSSTSGGSTGTSSISTSPKTANQLTVCCDDSSENQKILTIDSSSTFGNANNIHNLNSTSHMMSVSSNQTSNVANNTANKLSSNQYKPDNFMLNSNRSSISNNTITTKSDLLQQQRANMMLLQNVNSTSLFGNSASINRNNYIALLSSGSSNLGGLLNSTNTTPSLFSGNSQNLIANNFINLDFDINEQDDVNSDLNDNEDDDDSETGEANNEEDYIMSTSSNLEFLKAHSLFSKTPLNYYPSLNSANVLSNGKNKQSEVKLEPNESQNLPISPKLQTLTIYSEGTNSKNFNTQLVNSANAALDFRFSTFLPPTYATNGNIVNKTNQEIL